jgi:hypothetical protein
MTRAEFNSNLKEHKAIRRRSVSGAPRICECLFHLHEHLGEAVAG